MDFAILAKYGLQESDVRLYRSLVELGQSKTGPIIKKSGLMSSSVYESLRRLVGRGLVSFHVRNNTRYYQASPLDQFIDSIEEDTEFLRRLSQEVKTYSISKQERNETNVFEGVHGYKYAATRHLEQCDKGAEVCIISFSPRLVNIRELRLFYKKIDQEIIRRKHLRVRMLLDKRFRGVEQDKKGIEDYQIRCMPPGYFNPSAMNISKHQVLLSVWGEHPIVFAINNPRVIESFRQNFEFLWKMAK